MLPKDKPLGGKNYGSIGHLPGSRLGPADHHVHEGQANICLHQKRDNKDVITVTEKLDGSNCGVFRSGDQVLALGRAGYLARTSQFEQHRMFADWVDDNKARFLDLLKDGERAVGEWLAQAHGTRYVLPHEPFVIFDLMVGPRRIWSKEARERVIAAGFIPPRLIHFGGPCSIERTLEFLTHSGHGAVDPVEGAVWRVEREREFDFMAKYVRPEKKDGCYLPEMSGGEAIWNWKKEEPCTTY